MRKLGWIGIMLAAVLATTAVAAQMTGTSAAGSERIGLTLLNWLHHDAVVDNMDAATAGHIIIDLRRPEDYARGHIPGAVNIPEFNVVAQIGAVAPDHNRPILVYGYDATHSVRSVIALRLLAYTQVQHLKDGLPAAAGG
jgi:rhodanese-related sulfurtransferase